jgi:Sulfotransferase family
VSASTDAASRPGAPPKRAPDFFIVGHPKCGTSALFRMLAAHPGLHLPRKEPHYFVPELRSRYSTRFSGGIEEYLSLFEEARPDQLIGEATTTYLWSQTAAARIAEVQPDARIIAILREPASFLRSLHLQFVRSHVETEGDLRRALALEDDRREGRRIPASSTRPKQLLYSEHVRYTEQLRRYRDLFGPERVLVLIYEDFRADNEATLRQVLRFLDRDETTLPSLEVNRATAMRSPRLYNLVRTLYLGRAPAPRAVKRSVKAVTSQRLRRSAMRRMRRMQREPPPPDEQLMRELRTRFLPEVVALSDYLQRDLVSFWGYDVDR